MAEDGSFTKPMTNSSSPLLTTKLRTFLLLASVFFYLNCLVANLGVSLYSPKNYSNPNDSLFLLGLLNQGNCRLPNGLWARNITTNRSYCVPVEKLGEGAHTVLYKEAGLNTSLNFNQILNTFEGTIHPKLEIAIGTARRSPSSQTKIAILVLDILDGATPGSPYVAGFFDPLNYYADDLFSPLRSNQMDILYMDGIELANATRRDPNVFFATLAHEHQHLLRFGHMINSNRGFADDIWINEGTSEVASDIAGFGPQTGRIDCFRGRTNATGASACPNGMNGVSLVDWDNLDNCDSSYVLKQYSYAYVFMKYLYENAGTTVDQRDVFFKDSVVGRDGIRANVPTNLMQLFQTTPRFSAYKNNPQNLNQFPSTNNDDVFFRLYTVLLSHATNMPANPVIRSSTSATSTPVDLSQIQRDFPFPSDFSSISNNPYPLGTIPFFTDSQGRIGVIMPKTTFYFVSTASLLSMENTTTNNFAKITTTRPSRELFSNSAYSTGNVRRSMGTCSIASSDLNLASKSYWEKPLRKRTSQEFWHSIQTGNNLQKEKGQSQGMGEVPICVTPFMENEVLEGKNPHSHTAE